MRRLPLLLLALSSCQSKAPASQRPPASPPPVVAQTPPDAGPPAPPTPPEPEGPTAASRTVSRWGGVPRPAWFLCDGTNRARIAVVERDEGGARATLTWLDKRLEAVPVRQTYALGEASPGAGQIYYSLLKDGKEVGHLHAVNPGMLPDPARAWIPAFVSLQAEGVDLTCRWMLGVRLIGFDGRRSVLVTEEKGGLTYRSFDFADAAQAKQTRVEGYGQTTVPASQTVQGGTEAHTADGSTFTFRQGGYGYVLRVGLDASLDVVRDGQSVQRSELLAWTYAPPPA